MTAELELLRERAKAAKRGRPLAERTCRKCGGPAEVELLISIRERISDEGKGTRRYLTGKSSIDWCARCALEKMEELAGGAK